MRADPGALQTDCDRGEAEARTVSVDSTVVRAHQHAACARHAPPQDIDPDRLAPIALSEPSSTGGEIESQEF